MKKFQGQARNINFHIDSKFSDEMAQMSKIVRLVQTSCDFYNEDHPVRQEPIYTPGIGNYYPVRPEFHHLSSPDQLQSLQ